MGRREQEIRELSNRLQRDLLALSGNAAMPPDLRWQLLIPVALLVGAVVLFGMSPNARKSAVLRTALLISTRALENSMQKKAPAGRGFFFPG